MNYKKRFKKPYLAEDGNSGYINGDTIERNGVKYIYKNGSFEPIKKRSGAKEVRGVTKGGGDYFGVVGWNYSRKKGMISFSAFENKKSTRFSNAHGEESIMLMFEVIFKDTGQKHLEIAQYKFNTGKAFLSKLGMVVSTKAPNGGYFGGMKKK